MLGYCKSVDTLGMKSQGKAHLHCDQDLNRETGGDPCALQGMLNHTVLADARHLEGLYQRAFDRICNQVNPAPSNRPHTEMTDIREHSNLLLSPARMEEGTVTKLLHAHDDQREGEGVRRSLALRD